jgi:hypothetical protein
VERFNVFIFIVLPGLGYLRLMVQTTHDPQVPDILPTINTGLFPDTAVSNMAECDRSSRHICCRAVMVELFGTCIQLHNSYLSVISNKTNHS